MSKTLIVLEGNCGDEGEEYRAWLEENLPDDIELDFRSGCSGVGGGMLCEYEEDWDESEIWWNKFINR